jgi:ferrous iron transport protein B
MYDLGLPIVLVLNMTDIAERKNKSVNIEKLKEKFPDAIIVTSNARVGLGKNRIIEAIESIGTRKENRFIESSILKEKEDFLGQEEEAKERFRKIDLLLTDIVIVNEKVESKSNKIDRVLVHPVFGFLIFGLILITIFQFIFTFATIPMDFIDGAFGYLSANLDSLLPAGELTNLLCQGIIPGIGGVVIFIPQIALLFFFIALLEESGYLSRVVFIMDRLMRPLGLNGKSVVPLLSSVACAIPGIMSARTISDWKERTITILVAPLMSCSARIPVYTILIALVIPNERVFGFVNLQGLVLFGLYALGTISALVIALILKKIIKTKEKGFLLLEMPSYKNPQFKNVGILVFEKVKVFIFDAGKIILAISIILWALASYGPSGRMQMAEQNVMKMSSSELSVDEKDQLLASARLENSYIGIMGKSIEPVIKPLGYDWKIGVSLITSFAAREVFVGSMATIFAVKDGIDESTLIEKMRKELKADGTPVFTLASGASLMVFYVFAMQCMATLAVVKRETKSWKWPLIQVVYMGALAYFAAWITFIILS